MEMSCETAELALVLLLRLFVLLKIKSLSQVNMFVLCNITEQS